MSAPSRPRRGPRAAAGLCAAALLLAAGAHAQAAPAASTPPAAGDPAHHVRQARHFLKRGWIDDAALELEAARSTAAGQASFEVWWLSCAVAWEGAQPAAARAFAREAFARAPDGGARAEVEAWLAHFDQNLGLVTIEGPAAGQSTRMQLEQRGLVFDPNLQQLVDKLALRWRERAPLPVETALPIGDYSVNGVAFTVRPGELTTVRLPMAAMGNKGLAALQVTRLEVGGGVVMALGALKELPPAPAAQLALTVPAGQLLLGGMADFAPQSADLGDERLRAPGGFSGGLRVGGELFTSLPLSIRPSAVLRAGQLPAAPLRCDPAGDRWACRPGVAADGELPVLVRGFAWMPGAELVIEYREAGRTTALGAGLKAEVDAVLGVLPAAGTARAGSARLPWTLEDTHVNAAQLRLLANLSFAF